MLREMEGRDFAIFLGRFLPTARHAPFNYAAILGMVVSPVEALIFAINWLRAVITWTAFELFLAALVESL